jgi:hypothetical protein
MGEFIMNTKPELHLDINNKKQVQTFNYALNLASLAEIGNDFLAQFWNELVSCPDIYEEFFYYAEHGEFLCKFNIEGYTIIDIMVYQVDHFKSALDKPDMSKYKNNGYFMVLMAFDTLLKMKADSTGYIFNMKHDSGTDLPDKFHNIASLDYLED